MTAIPRGECSRCAHWVPIRRNGTVREHRNLSNVAKVCPGSGLPPRYNPAAGGRS